MVTSAMYAFSHEPVLLSPQQRYGTVDAEPLLALTQIFWLLGGTPQYFKT
jgi:hypothetical protein